MRGIFRTVAVPGLFLLALATLMRSEGGAVTLASVFQDGMVVQARRPVPIWGTAEPGERVRVAFAGQELENVAGSDGHWRVTLAPLEYAAGHAGQVLVVRGNNERRLRDVRIGEVWLVVGPQSYREWIEQGIGAPVSDRALRTQVTPEPEIEPLLRMMVRRESEELRWGGGAEGGAAASAVGLFFGTHLRAHLDVPIGLVDLSDAAASVLSYLPEHDISPDLMGPSAAERARQWAVRDHGRWYRSAVATLAPMAVRGVLWAQAETDVDHADVYADWLKAMIMRWRADFENVHLPVVIMQLPSATRGDSWVSMRQAQAKAAGDLLDVALAVTIDLGSGGPQAYARPYELGERLGRLARAFVYGEDLPAAFAASAGRPRRESGQIIFHWFNAAGGMVATSRSLQQFELVDETGKRIPTEAELIGPRTVAVRVPDGVEVRELRYGWVDCFFPDLRTAFGQPAAPFRMTFAPPTVTGPERWRDPIDAYNRQDRLRRPEEGGVLFIGSSSIRMWSTLQNDFPGMGAINRGFGGSISSEAVHYFERLVLPYRPRTIVFYSGENDIASNYRPEDVLAAFAEFCRKTHDVLPRTRVLFLALKPSPFRWKLWEKMAETNRLLARYCAQDERTQFVDTAAALLAADGGVRPEFFLDDELHLNRAGYEAWVAVLEPVLREAR